MSILSVLLLFFVELFSTLVNKQLETQSLSNVQQDANYLLSRFSYDFGRATSIEVPATAGAMLSTLRLKIGSTFYDYMVNAGSLVSSHSAVLENINSSETTISNASFQRLGTGATTDVVQISFDITSTIKESSGYDITHFSTTLGTREK